MKAAVLESLGFDNIRVKEIAEPTPGPYDVLVRMRAASLNYRDLVAIDGGGSQQKRSDLILLRMVPVIVSIGSALQPRAANLSLTVPAAGYNIMA